MTFPKIAADDLVLFGSLTIVAIGAGIIVAVMTESGFLAFGTAMIVVGFPSALIAFMASAVEETK